MKRPKFIPLRDPAEVPELKTEAEARAFWDTHEVTAEYLERAGPVPDSELPPVRESSRLISLRLSRDMEARLKALARRKGKAGSSCWSGFTRGKARGSPLRRTRSSRPRVYLGSSGTPPVFGRARLRRPFGADPSTQASWACRRREPWVASGSGPTPARPSAGRPLTVDVGGTRRRSRHSQASFQYRASGSQTAQASYRITTPRRIRCLV
jgi:hypothetical protein